MSEAIDIVGLIKNEELAPVTQFSNQTQRGEGRMRGPIVKKLNALVLVNHSVK